jgi:hypothetical protein
MKCYNCGKPLTKKSRTKEHIPAKAYYAGYGNKYKKNRLTVPACKACNNEYSETDQEIRDAIGISNDLDEGTNEFTRKSAKSILKRKRNELHLDQSGKVEAVSFNYSDFKKSAIKDFKGIFYKKFGTPIPEDWKIEIIVDFEPDHKVLDAGAAIFEYLDKDLDWSVSGHHDIFRYKLKTLVPDKKENIIDSGELDKAVSVASIQVYHDKIGFVVVATPPSFLKKAST